MASEFHRLNWSTDSVFAFLVSFSGTLFHPAACSPKQTLYRSSYARTLRPVSASLHSSDENSFVHPNLQSASHVFIRRDTIRRPLEQPYQGPYKVLRRK
ncbi:hypothetical protein AVEN_244453-1 [Araneus ventricosus]|uniref:Uncharacterized protein n=1 Tax=Araneus ventricosus TaxID=182803 RepID=A0A4Y2INY3_ARAVE|nr:hypothetical protein AVEN_244453-1 [Araneus ventricosus]